MLSLLSTHKLSITALLSASLLLACTFDTSTSISYLHDYPWPEDTPIVSPSENQIELISEQAQTLAVLHGYSCASSQHENRQHVVRVRESINTNRTKYLISSESPRALDARRFNAAMAIPL